MRSEPIEVKLPRDPRTADMPDAEPRYIKLRELFADWDPKENATRTVDPTRYLVKFGENVWAALRGVLNEVTQTSIAPVIDKCSGVFAAADVFNLDLGYGPQAHP